MESSPRISIVEDDALVRRALGRLCKLEGYVVDLFASAEDFLDASGEDTSDCLILDVHLPVRSGLQLQDDLKAAGTRLPIIFVTAFQDEQARATALDAGAAEFLQKPLDNERLLAALRQALEHPTHEG